MSTWLKLWIKVNLCYCSVAAMQWTGKEAWKLLAALTYSLTGLYAKDYSTVSIYIGQQDI